MSIRDRRWENYEFYSARLYHMFYHSITRESSDWGVLDKSCIKDWMYERYLEVGLLKATIYSVNRKKKLGIL